VRETTITDTKHCKQTSWGDLVVRDLVVKIEWSDWDWYFDGI
jgi:hypothetical protein